MSDFDTWKSMTTDRSPMCLCNRELVLSERSQRASTLLSDGFSRVTRANGKRACDRQQKQKHPSSRLPCLSVYGSAACFCFARLQTKEKGRRPTGIADRTKHKESLSSSCHYYLYIYQQRFEPQRQSR
mmetsp:Transcript_22265/g.46914  ORF Transcript_22265/g.46914 Transcript_22265/m.46914 type:complete len:128 (-) Transcript_22265:331-714(-)